MSITERTPDQATKAPLSARKLAIMAVFIALSAAGAMVKIPSPLGTVGLDAAPGFFTALAFTGWMGFVVIAIGHVLGSAIVGFPLSIPVHLVIALGMGLCALAFRWVGRRGAAWLVVSVIITSLLNSFALGLVVVPIGGWGMYLGAMPSLLLGSVVNVVLAAVAYRALRDSKLLD